MATTDGMVPDDDGEVRYDEEAKEITCNRCGKGGFHWDYYKNQSRLFDVDGNLHVCP